MSRIPEYNMNKRSEDLSRPPFQRKTGQIGVYVDILEVKPVDRRQYGSERFMMISLGEKLLENFKKIPPHKIKATLLKHEFPEGVVLENFIADMIMTVSCNTSFDLDEFWKSYKAGTLAQHLKSCLETSEIQKDIQVTALDLRVRCFDDEYKVCRSELLKNGIITHNLAQFEQDKHMLRMIKRFQKDYTKELYALRDQLHCFDVKLGEFIQLAKTNQPPGTYVYKCVNDIHRIRSCAKEQPATCVKVLDHYIETVDHVKKACNDLEENVVMLFSQVHAGCETEHQRECKQLIKKSLTDVRAMLSSRSDISKIKHPNWEGKVLLMERKLLLGIVCVIPCVIEKVIDVDNTIDEYFHEVKIDLGD